MPHTPLRRLLLAAFLALTILPASAQEWRGWNIHAADYPNGQGMDAFLSQTGVFCHTAGA